MTRSQLEVVVGLFVLVGLAAVAYFALRIGAGQFVAGETYDVQARFTNVGGLNPGARVMIAGVVVGKVERINLTPEFQAIVDLRLARSVVLPSDSIISVRTSGFIGDKFLSIQPGGDSETVAAGGMLTDTESAVDLESLISRFAFGNVPARSGPAGGRAAPE